MIVSLPAIRVPKAELVQPRAVKEGELAHVRFQFEPRASARYMLVPRAIAAQWVEIGVREQPATVTLDTRRQSAEQLGLMAAVRVRFGLHDTKSFFVPMALARSWEEHAQRFERLYAEYNRLMRGGT
jgi:hypothetical protein